MRRLRLRRRSEGLVIHDLAELIPVLNSITSLKSDLLSLYAHFVGSRLVANNQCSSNALDFNAFDFVHRNLIVRAVIELGGPR
jgi:hypothetical protein